MLGAAEAVLGRGVVIGNSSLERAAHRGPGLLGRHFHHHASQRRTTQPEPGDLQSGAADLMLF